MLIYVACSLSFKSFSSGRPKPNPFPNPLFLFFFVPASPNCSFHCGEGKKRKGRSQNGKKKLGSQGKGKKDENSRRTFLNSGSAPISSEPEDELLARAILK